MSTPLVSVITVTYNSARYVVESIESVLASSYTNFELIIGDDASTDSTWELIESFEDSRIVRYRNEINLGEYPNRNKAISLAKGSYIIFIDGDDLIYPHGLEFLVRMLHAFPSCAMALMTWFRNDIFFPVILTPKQFYLGEYFGHGFLGTAFSNVLFRASVLKAEGGLSATHKIGDDFIRYKIAAKYPSLLVNDGATWWRETPGQASQVWGNSVMGVIESFQLKFEFLRLETCPLTKEEKDLAAGNLFLSLTKIIIKSTLKGYFKRAYRLHSEFHIPLKYYFLVRRKPLKINPLGGYSPVNPYRLPLSENPFVSK
ncbi:MAG: glycosyltransferase family 2 protein [Cyclobacteriaceae bacterium]|nr:glycosyltransferase family 2 protein [Cyclobacteriaceae bacterium]